MRTVDRETCVAHGGHCWESDGAVYTSNPPQYPEHCKHCDARRVGVEQPSIRWRYDDERENAS